MKSWTVKRSWSHERGGPNHYIVENGPGDLPRWLLAILLVAGCLGMLFLAAQLRASDDESGKRQPPAFECSPVVPPYLIRCEAHYVYPYTPSWEVYVQPGIDGCGAWQSDKDRGVVVWLNRSSARRPYSVVMKIRHRPVRTVHYDADGRPL